MLFLLVLAVSAPFALGASGETHYVSPSCSSQSSSCVTLDTIATAVSRRFWIQGNFKLVFLPGIHRLSQSIYVTSAYGTTSSRTRELSLTLRGMGKPVIQCPGNGTSIYFTELSRLEIDGLAFSNCGGIDPSIGQINLDGLRVSLTTMVTISNSSFDISWIAIRNCNNTYILQSKFKNHIYVNSNDMKGRLFVSNSVFNGRPRLIKSRFEGLKVENVQVFITNSVFQLNSWSKLYVHEGAPLLLQNSAAFIRAVAFQNNVASACGGVLAKNSNITMTSVVFRNNTAFNGSVCAVRSIVNITNTSIMRNTAVGRHGTGGLKATQSIIRLKNVLFSSNTGYDGGAVQMNDSILFARNTFFKKNTAIRFGGAVYSVSSTATFQHSFFSNNSDMLGKTFFSINSRLRKPGGKCSDDGSEFQCRMSKAQSLLSGTCNSFTREKLNEGYKPEVYKDNRGIPTIGIGFNLRRSGARQDISAVGANYDKLLSGRQSLTANQIRQLFDQDMANAVSCAQRFVGSNWYRLGETRQSAVADMAFNLGCTKLHGFRRFQAALQSRPPNYSAAVREMKDSGWCRQVGFRCGRNVVCMSSG